MNTVPDSIDMPIQVARMLRKYDPAIRQLVSQELKQRLADSGRAEIRLEDVGYCVSVALEKFGRLASGFDKRLTRLSMDAYRRGDAITTDAYRAEILAR